MGAIMTSIKVSFCDDDGAVGGNGTRGKDRRIEGGSIMKKR